MLGRLLGAVGLGAGLGGAMWLHSTIRHPAAPFAWFVAAGAAVGAVLALFTDLPFLPEATTFGSAEPEPPAPRRRAPPVPPKPATPAPAPTPLDSAVETSLPSWSTAGASLLLAVVAAVVGAFGGRVLLAALGLANAEGDPFWWGFDQIFFLFGAMIASVLGAALVGFAVVAALTAIAVARRTHGARAGALVVFLLAAAPASSYAFSGWPESGGGVLAACVVGAILLSLPSTNEDFGGEWGLEVVARRLSWLSLFRRPPGW